MHDDHYVMALLELQQAGFSAREIRRLGKYYRKYTEEEVERTIAERRHLEFARWLVRHGKLNEQVICESSQTFPLKDKTRYT